MMFSSPQSTALINFFLTTFLFLSILFYKYFFPKKKVNLEFILPILLLLPILSLTKPGDFESGDFNIHIYRMMSFYDSLKEGQLIPSWAGELNNTYGYPLFIFNYQLPYYIISGLKLLGFSFIFSTKIYLATNLFLSGIFMYLFIRYLLKNKFAAFFSATLYTFNPYHLIDVHFRATLGETTIFTLVPLVMYFTYKYIKKNSLHFLIINTILIAFLFVSHTLLGGLFFLVSYFFAILCILPLKTSRISKFLSITFSYVIGGIASIYAWIPFFIYKNQYGSNQILDVYIYPISKVFISPWRYGLLYQGPNGELALVIGFAQIIVFIISVFMLFSKKFTFTKNLQLIFWIVLTIGCLFMMTSQSQFIWKVFNFLSPLAPTGRLSLIISFTTAIIGSYVTIFFIAKKNGKLFIYSIIILTVYSTILNWSHRRFINTINDTTLRSQIAQSTSNGEGHFYANTAFRNPKEPWYKTPPEKPINIISGDARITQGNRTNSSHEYFIDAESHLHIIENTLYFEGWKAISNNSPVPIKPASDGSIELLLPPGKHDLKVIYEDILPYKVSKIISIFVFSTLCLTLLIIIILQIKTTYAKDSYR